MNITKNEINYFERKAKQLNYGFEVHEAEHFFSVRITDKSMIGALIIDILNSFQDNAFNSVSYDKKHKYVYALFIFLKQTSKGGDAK